jgi:hypothetical protein
MLTDEAGAARFIVGLRGTTAGITKEETEAISGRLAALIAEHGLVVPERPASPSTPSPPHKA